MTIKRIFNKVVGGWGCRVSGRVGLSFCPRASCTDVVSNTEGREEGGRCVCQCGGGGGGGGAV